MKGWLLDTNIISELRKGTRADSRVKAWRQSVRTVPLHLSVITLMEIRRGIVLLERRDPQSAAHLAQWFRNLKREYRGRILPVTLRVAEICSGLSPDQPLPAMDALLAATARARDLKIATRNVADFIRSGVPMEIHSSLAGRECGTGFPARDPTQSRAGKPVSLYGFVISTR